MPTITQTCYICGTRTINVPISELEKDYDHFYRCHKFPQLGPWIKINSFLKARVGLCISTEDEEHAKQLIKDGIHHPWEDNT